MNDPLNLNQGQPATAPMINMTGPAQLAPATGGWKRVLMQVGALTLAAGAGAAGGYVLAKRSDRKALTPSA